ncbi:MAG: aminotransferase class IV [Spirochaetia bacterium]|nr:aminotransferase class IV [Spirochaetia bacterium]
MKYALKNLELIDEKDAVIPVTQRELFSSFGVYESIKVSNGQAEHVNDHLERLFDSARILKLEHDFSFNDIISSLNMLITANNDLKVSLKLQLIGGRTPCLFAFTTKLPEYPEEYYIHGAKVISFAGERIYPHAKSNCLLLNYMAAREAGLSGALDAILIDRSGFALEGSRSNLFAVKGKTLITSEEDVLYGVTRRRTIEIAKNLNLTIEFKKIALKDIKEHIFDEVFITSTSMGAIPVNAIDDIKIGSSFPVTSLINTNLI